MCMNDVLYVLAWFLFLVFVNKGSELSWPKCVSIYHIFNTDSIDICLGRRFLADDFDNFRFFWIALRRLFDSFWIACVSNGYDFPWLFVCFCIDAVRRILCTRFSMFFAQLIDDPFVEFIFGRFCVGG